LTGSATAAAKDDFRDYIYNQRAASSVMNRTFAALGATTVAAFIFINPYILSRSNALYYDAFCIPAVLILVCYIAFSRTELYRRAVWSEFWLVSLISVCILGAVDALSRESAQIGWSPLTILFCNIAILLAYATLTISNNFRAFAIWCAGLFVVFTIWLYNSRIALVPAVYGISSVATLASLSLFGNWSLDRRSRKIFRLQRLLEIEKSNSEQMLYSILPEDVARRLQHGEAIADSFSDATVVFVDIVGSSSLARSLTPKTFIGLLNDVFLIADDASTELGVEKVKTIGDAYLAVAGARGGGDANAAIQFAIRVVDGVRELARIRGLDIDVRIGIHSGPVVGGVIGQKRATYDYWGDTMNVAARVQSAASPGGIAVTRQTYFATKDTVAYATPRVLTLKGIGEVQVYDVSARSSAVSAAN
jgi:adenylate cyclase